MFKQKEGGVRPEKKRNIYLGLQRGANQTLRDGELKPFRNDLAPLGSGFTLYIVLISWGGYVARFFMGRLHF